MRCPAIELLTEIRDRLRNLDTLEEMRRKHRELVARQRSVAKSVTSHDVVTSQKEDEKGKETFPPAPPIEKSQKKKKGAGEGEDARAREVSPEVLLAERLRTRRVTKVAAYNAEIGGNVDADYFVDYYADHWPHDWRARLRNWLKEDKPSGRIQPRAVGNATARAPSTQIVDWTLCRERCANCRGEGCACGIAVPPDCEERPRPPEECPAYRPLTTNH